MNEQEQQMFIQWLAEKTGAKTQEEVLSYIDKLQKANKLEGAVNQFKAEISNDAQVAKLGAKLEYINRLNNKCPEGYEVEKFLLGGKPCSRCKKVKVDKNKKGSTMDNIRDEISKKRCGGKAKKMQQGGTTGERDGGYWSMGRVVELPGVTISAPKPKPKTNPNLSIVDYLISKGADSSYNNRHRLWQATNIGNGKPYKGTAEQNTALLNYMKPQLDANTNTNTNNTDTKLDSGTLYGWMVNNGMQKQASFKERTNLYKQIFGNEKYTGSVEQNTSLLKALKQQQKK